MEYWEIDKIALDSEVNKRVSFIQYQHSNIPLFHYSIIPSARQELKPQKILLISISCRISKTYGSNFRIDTRPLSYLSPILVLIRELKK